MIKNVSFHDFRNLDGLSLDLAPITMLTGSNGVGKSSVLEGLYCLLGGGYIDVSELTRYSRSYLNLGNGFDYKKFWEECPSFGKTSCTVGITTVDFSISWQYNKSSLRDLESELVAKAHIPIDDLTEFARFHWVIEGLDGGMYERAGKSKFTSAQILTPDGGFHLLFFMGQSHVAGCDYLNFFDLRKQFLELPLETEKKLTTALKILNQRITGVRLKNIKGGLSIILDDENEISLEALGYGAISCANLFSTLIDLERKYTRHNLPYVLLIDEIGAGVHYSVMLDLWKYIKDFSEQHPGIQFIFTSHSDDCIRAFCRAFEESDNAQVVSLHRQLNDKTIPTYFAKDEFEEIISGSWEVRG